MNPGISLNFARKAFQIANETHEPVLIVRAFNTLGMALLKNRDDSAYYYFMNALELAEKSGVENQKPLILYNLGMMYYEASDYKTAIVYFDSTIRRATLVSQFVVLSNANNAIGLVYYDMQDSIHAIRYFRQAHEIAKEHNLYREQAVAIGNLARIENESSNSVKMLKSALEILQKQPGNLEEMASVLVNLGMISTDPDSAIYYYKRALAISSPRNLYLTTIAAYNNLAYSYLDKHEVNKAAECLHDNAIPVALKTDNQDWLSTLYDSYSDVLSAEGKDSEANQFLKKSIEAKTIADKRLAASQTRLLLSLLDTKNKEKQIQQNETRLQKSRLTIVGISFLLITCIFVFIWIYQRNRIKSNRRRIDAARQIILMEERAKSRIARELHDLAGPLAAGLLGLSENFTINSDQQTKELSDQLSEMSNSIRNIAHHMNNSMFENTGFNLAIRGLCADMKNLTGISVTLHFSLENISVNSEIMDQTYRIVQEWLVNASRYARFSTVTITVALNKKDLQVSYKDKGSGFDPENAKQKGIGIQTIFERVKLLDGQVSLYSAPGQGTFWKISIPIK